MTSSAKHYRAVRNAVYDQDGKQIAVVLPVNCTKRLANEMASYAAQQANHDENRKLWRNRSK
jgi:hypothetical protein